MLEFGFVKIGTNPNLKKREGFRSARSFTSIPRHHLWANLTIFDPVELCIHRTAPSFACKAPRIKNGEFSSMFFFSCYFKTYQALVELSKMKDRQGTCCGLLYSTSVTSVAFSLRNISMTSLFRLWVFMMLCRKKYLKTLLFCVCEAVDGPMIEEYSFSFSYSGSDNQEVSLNINRSGTKKGGTFKHNSTTEITPSQMRSSACKMVRTLVQLMRTLDKMPEEGTLY